MLIQSTGPGRKVGPSGPTTARIAIVGEAPGRDEERDGQPFVGVSGQLLRDCLLGVGIQPSDVFFTNLCRYRPPNNELRAFFDSKGTPNDLVLEGLTELREELDAVNPNVIIPVGNYPLRFLTGRGRWTKEGPTGIGDYRGYPLRGSDFARGRTCLPSWHPAAATRQYPLKHILRADLAKAKLYSGSSTLQRPRKAIVVDPEGPDGEAWVHWLVSPQGTLSPVARLSSWNEAENRWMEGGPDSETIQVESGSFLSSDIEYIGTKLLCVGFTRHSDVAVVFTTPNRARVGFVRDLLLSGVPLCFQNGMFDCSILEWFFDIPAIKFLKHDTMYAMHAAYIEMKKDLGFIGSLFTQMPPWWQHIDKKFWTEVRDGQRSIKEVLPYNGGDVCVTHEAMESLLSDELLDQDVLNTYRHEMDLVEPLWETSRRGVLIDTARLNTLRKQLEEEIIVFNLGIKQYNANRDVNVKSGDQVAAFLYDHIGVPKVGPKTPGGKWKMDDETLADLLLKCRDERQRVAIRMVREARERRDLISKFCDIELDDDGRMRCHYDPAKTDTGRLASRKFYPTDRGSNLQNVPRDTRIRAVFIPDKGYIFGYADLKSAESLVVAHITGDLEMLRLHSPEYMDGTKDGHKYVASFLLDRAIDRITKDERYLGKRVRHAGNYGMSWKRLHDIVNADAQETGVSITPAQAKALIHKYRTLHPGLQAWWNDVQAELWRTHTLYTRHRRKRVFYDRPDSILPEAIAYDPQGTVADTLNMGWARTSTKYLTDATCFMRRRDLALGVMESVLAKTDRLVCSLGFQKLLQVHDAIGFQVPEKNAEEAFLLLRDLMDIPVPITRKGVAPYEIHIPVEIQYGYNWGEFDPKKPLENPNGLRSWHEPKTS